MTNEKELKPCPFCGGKAQRFPKGFSNAKPTCLECGVSCHSTNIWNNRAEDLENAAIIADNEATNWFGHEDGNEAAKNIARDIRALQSSQTKPEVYDVNQKFSKRNAGEIVAYLDGVLEGKYKMPYAMNQSQQPQAEIPGLAEAIAEASAVSVSDGSEQAVAFIGWDYLHTLTEAARAYLASFKRVLQ